MNKTGPQPADFGYSELNPRVWHGMTGGAWMSLLRSTPQRTGKLRKALFLSVCASAVSNSLLSGLANITPSGSKSSGTVVGDPVFIIGFWRSGTTWLQELLMQDPRYATTSGLQCFAPRTFTALRLAAPLFDRILPASRPADDMPMSMHSPQEDEFAILNLGLETPYRYLAFPSSGFDPDREETFWPVSESRQAQWLAGWTAFLQRVQASNPGRTMVLKSPPHTARIALILRAFPKAKFIHLGRNPQSLFPSNLKLLRSMLATQSLERQVPADDELMRVAFAMHTRLYSSFFAEAGALPPHRICSLRFEDLCRDPETAVRNLYERLDLGDIASALPAIRSLIAERHSHKVQSYRSDGLHVPDEARDMVERYCEHFGYPLPDRA